MPTASTSPNSDRLFRLKRDGNGDDRNHRRPPTLQEHDDDEDHQQHGNADSDLDFVDRLLDEGRRIVDDGVLDTGGEALRQLRHRRADALRGIERVGAWPLEDGERHGGVAIQI
jgi:hypothetical protein